MVHTVFFASDFGLILSESQRVGWNVDFGDDFNVVLFAQFLQVDKLLFGVRTVLGRQTGIGVAFKAESGLGFIPVVAEELTETIVVQMHLKGIHLIVGHHLGEVTQIIDAEELTSAVNHETAQFILGLVGCNTTRQLALCILL